VRGLRASIPFLPRQSGLREGAVGKRGRGARERLGLWNSPAYRVESADDVDGLDRLTQTYQLVEGKVLSVGEGAGRASISISPAIGKVISPPASPART
jgi:hypothetical protein